MTLDEKIAQLGGVWPRALMEGGAFSHAGADRMLRDGIGHISRIAASTVLGPRDSATLANAIQRYLVEHTRLGIPAIVHEESCAGYTARDATCFPQAIGLAATWDPELVREMAAVIRRQMRAAGAHHTLAPVLDIARDARWGRVEETYGEDPYLTSCLGVAYVQGIQGDDLATGVVATGKHFLGYAASEGGMNWAPAHIGPRELREVYAAPFEAAIREARLASVMNSYAEIDGVPLAASKELLRDLLRDELGFDGTVVSDYFTVATLRSYHRIAATKAEAAARAIEAGIDVELPALDCYPMLRDALATGRIDMATIDASVARVLRQKFELGLFEQPYVDAAAAPAAFDTAEDRALARRLAQESIVLLKNDAVDGRPLLPLSRDVKRIAVIGPAADSARLLQGDYHYPTHLEIVFGPIVEDGDVVSGEATPILASTAPAAGTDDRINLANYFVPHVTLLEGIRNHAPASLIAYARGCGVDRDDLSGFDAAVEAARSSDVAIVCVGTKSGLIDGCTSGESSDRSDLGLPGRQQALVEAIVATLTPVVVVLINGGVLSIPWIAEHVPAVVEAWLPGEEAGNAIADILFGDVNPSGRLPVSMPRSAGQVPVYYNHKPSGGRTNWRTHYVDSPATPLYPFGHGLSYATFEYGEIAMRASEVAVNGTAEISIDVTNTGDRAGDEVVQLYIHDLDASTTRPVKQLAGFTRVHLTAGERRIVVFALDVSQLALYDRDMRFVVEPGAVEVMVGASSDDIRARTKFEITGATRALTRDEIRPTTVHVIDV